MNLHVEFIDETKRVAVEQMEKVEDLLQHAAEVENIENLAEVSVTFVDNSRIQEINAMYRSKDYPTDVISFAMEELGEDEPSIVGEAARVMLGDIIISIDKTAEQASEYGHSFERELGFLAVHGFLHLLGYDHENEDDEAVMFGKQKEILDSYGLTR